MQPVHVLVDLENNQPTLDDVQRLVPGVTHAWLFHSRSQVKRLASFAPLGAEQTPVPISRPGKNALDFHLAFYVGYIAARNPGARLVIVAIDQGYGPMIEHAISLGFDVTQVPFKPGARGAKKVAGKKTVARKAPAAKAPSKKGAAGARALAAKKGGPALRAPRAPASKAPIAPLPAPAAPAATAPAAKAPAKKAPAKQPAAKKAAAKKVNVATQPAARKAKTAGAVPQVDSVEPPAGKAAAARSQPQPQQQPQRQRQRQPKQPPAPQPKQPANPQAKPQRKEQPPRPPKPEPEQQPKQQPKQQQRPKQQARQQPAQQPKQQPKQPPKEQPRPQRKAPATQRAPGKPPAAEKVLANLRTMGEKQPKKLRQLRRYVSSMLGTGEADPAVGRLVDHLVEIGYVRVSGEALAYPSATGGAGR